MPFVDELRSVTARASKKSCAGFFQIHEGRKPKKQLIQHLVSFPCYREENSKSLQPDRVQIIAFGSRHPCFISCQKLEALGATTSSQLFRDHPQCPHPTAVSSPLSRSQSLQSLFFFISSRALGHGLRVLRDVSRVGY